jgi:hypothetical protein
MLMHAHACTFVRQLQMLVTANGYVACYYWSCVWSGRNTYFVPLCRTLPSSCYKLRQLVIAMF